MTFPMDTNHFAPIAGGAPSDAATINTPLAQLSGAISELETLLSSSTGNVPVTYGEALTVRDAVYLNPDDNKVYAIDADSTALFGAVRGFVDATGPLNTIANLISSGIMLGFTGLTPWLPVYADTTGTGTITQTKPVPTLDGGQVAIVSMGVAISATEILVMPGFVDNRIRYQKRYSPALDETTTIEHGRNLSGFRRKYAAYVTQASTLTEYGSANQDVDVALRNQSPATYTTDQCTGGTIAFSSQHDGTTWAAANAFDDNTATDWLSATAQAVPQWLEYNFGVSKTVRRYTIRIRDEATTNAPAAFQLQYFDGSTWQTADTRAGQTWSVGETKTFDVSVPYTATRWRVYFTAAVSGDDISVSEIQMMEAATFADGADKLAQGFQISASSTVQSVRLWLKKVGSPTGNLTVKIQTNNAGNPSGTTVTNGTSGTIAASSLSTSYDWITFTFSTPPSLNAATQYHLVLETADSVSETNYISWGADGSSPSYANGEMKSEASAVWSAESKDACFLMLTQGLQYINPVMVDEWDSTFASMVAQAGDTGGSNINTHTTFKCKKAAGYADVTVEVVL